MKAKVTRYPNHEVRVAVYPERSPESLDSLVKEVPSEPRDRAFNIKSKLETAQRPRRLYLSRNGRNTILRAGSCFDCGNDTERLLLTGTLPGRLEEAHKALADFSSYASHTLCDWLTRRSPGCKWMYTWEFQKRGALHIHLVVELPLSVSAYVKEFFKDEWNRILSSVGVKSGVNLFKRTQKYIHSKKVTQADVVVCDREPSRYISKYISKKATNGFGTWRHPPKTWYQVSRSLLKTLRDSTDTFIAEGLSYSQARGFIEIASQNISEAVKGGQRFFDGAILAWSGYSYSDHFDIKDWSKNMINTRYSLSPTEVIAKHAVAAIRDYPQVRCWMRGQDWSGIATRITTGIATEPEMLLYIEATMTALMTGWDSLNRKTIAGHFLQRSHNWWEAKFKYRTISEGFKATIDKICEDTLTS